MEMVMVMGIIMVGVNQKAGVKISDGVKQTRVGVKTTIKDGVIKTMDGLESILDMDSVLVVISSAPSFYPGFSFGVTF